MSCLRFGLFLTFVVSSGWAEDPVPVDQRLYPDSINGCGPATILNLLTFSDERYRPVRDTLIGSEDGVKMRYLVDRYFKGKPSLTYPTEKRWGPHGIDCRDLVLGINELLAEGGLAPLIGTYLDRLPAEDGASHVVRCRDLIARSIAGGTMPLLSLRSFVVKRREENEGEPRWEVGRHHYVLITGLHEVGLPFGFELEVIDPWRGKRTRLYLHREGNGQPFRALRGVEGSGVWLDGFPFLQVLAPEVETLRPGNLEWSERFIVVANFIIAAP